MNHQDTGRAFLPVPPCFFMTMDADIEKAMTSGIVFKGKSNAASKGAKVKTKAKKKTYITGAHGSGSAKMKAEYRRRRANRHK